MTTKRPRPKTRNQLRTELRQLIDNPNTKLSDVFALFKGTQFNAWLSVRRDDELAALTISNESTPQSPFAKPFTNPRSGMGIKKQ